MYQSLPHPALVDRILTDYLREADLDGPVDHDIIRKCVINYAAKEDRRRFILFHDTLITLKVNIGSIDTIRIGRRYRRPFQCKCHTDTECEELSDDVT